MNYQIGDIVVHWTYGVGSVKAIEEIHLAGVTKWYYVIEMKTLKIWVPMDEALKGSLRFPVESNQFEHFLDILRTPGQLLPNRYLERRNALRSQLNKRTLEGLCHVIRDLTDRSRLQPLSYDDSSVLTSAQESLLDEWVISLGTDRLKASLEMQGLMQ